MNSPSIRVLTPKVREVSTGTSYTVIEVLGCQTPPEADPIWNLEKNDYYTKMEVDEMISRSRSRFGIEDDKGIMTRAIDMQDYSFAITEAESVTLKAEDASTTNNSSIYLNQQHGIITHASAGTSQVTSIRADPTAASLVYSDGTYTRFVSVNESIAFIQQSPGNERIIRMPYPSQDSFAAISVNGIYPDAQGDIALIVGSTTTADNGIYSNTADNFRWGGLLVEDTLITGNGLGLSLEGLGSFDANAAVDSRFSVGDPTDPVSYVIIEQSNIQLFCNNFLIQHPTGIEGSATMLVSINGQYAGNDGNLVIEAGTLQGAYDASLIAGDSPQIVAVTPDPEEDSKNIAFMATLEDDSQYSGLNITPVETNIISVNQADPEGVRQSYIRTEPDVISISTSAVVDGIQVSRELKVMPGSVVIDDGTSSRNVVTSINNDLIADESGNLTMALTLQQAYNASIAVFETPQIQAVTPVPAGEDINMISFIAQFEDMSSWSRMVIHPGGMISDIAESIAGNPVSTLSIGSGGVNIIAQTDTMNANIWAGTGPCSATLYAADTSSGTVFRSLIVTPTQVTVSADSAPPRNVVLSINGDLIADSSGNLELPASTSPVNLAKGGAGVDIDNSGYVITPGFKGHFRVPYNGIITEWCLIGEPETGGSCTFDVWKKNNAYPSAADSITAGAAKPSLTSQNFKLVTDLTGFSTTTVTAGDVFGWNLESASSLTGVILQLTIQKT